MSTSRIVGIVKRLSAASHAFASILLALASVSAWGANNSVVPASSNLDHGFRQMYNLDFAGAHTTFRQYQQSYPDDAMGYVSDAAAYLFAEFERLHILESDLFVDDSHFDHRSRLTPDTHTKELFDAHLAKSDELAAKVLAKDPKNVNAMFAQVMANGLRADYTALVEKRNIASLTYIKTARGQAQQLLTIDPTCYDAYLSLGAENYLLGTNAAPIRWALRMTGAETDKAKGIEQLRIVASKGHYLAPFARLLLAVAALRDKDPKTAKFLLASLATEFPDNKLYTKELSRIQ